MASVPVLLAGVAMILISVARGALGWRAMRESPRGTRAADDSIRGGAGALIAAPLDAHFVPSAVRGVMAGLPILGLGRRPASVAGIVLLSMLPVAAIGAPPMDGGSAAGARLSVEQLKGRYGDIFGFEIGTTDDRTYSAPRVKTLPETDPLAAFVNANDIFLSFLQVNGVDCNDLLIEGVAPDEFEGRCLDRMRASADVDAALLPAIDRYLWSRGGGLDGYESGPPAP